MALAVVGIDVGTSSVVIGDVKRGGVDIILNEASKRLTPSLVSFNGAERFLGEAAVTQVRTNMQNTITEVKRYIGRKFSEAGVQAELDENAYFNYVDLGNDELGVEVDYNNDTVQFSMTQIYAMLLVKAKQIVELNNPGIKSVDAVISVPAYYSHAQRKAVQDAATIAGLSCLRVLNEGTAAALSYGMFKGAKKEFPEGKETPIMFLDMGASACTCTIATFTNTSLKVLASVSDSTLGGRDFDTAIAKFFASEFEAKYKSNPWKNKKARLKLLMAAEKAKISISPHGVNSAPVSVECLFEDRDFNGNLTEEKLVELMGAVVHAKLGAVIRKALAIAGMSGASDLASIELVGGGMRPRLVKRVAAQTLGMALDEATGHGLMTSMNLDETIARGCALSCASLSTKFKINKPFEIIDTVTYPVKITYEAQAAGAAEAADAMDEDEGAGPAAGDTSTVVFNTGDKLVPGSGLVRRVRLARKGDFEVGLEYDVPSDLSFMWPAGMASTIGKVVVKAPADAATPAGTTKYRINVQYDVNGCVYVKDADAMKPVEEAPAAGAGAAAGGDVDMKTGEAGEAGTTASSSTETPGSAADAPKKTRYKRITAPFALAAGLPVSLTGMSKESLKAATDKELAMQAADAEIHATQDMRNSLEAYIYNARSAVGDSLQQYSTQPERDTVEASLGDMENWLYGDGFESDKATYEAKLKQLKAQVEPLFARKWESENRYAAIESFREAIGRFRDVEANKTGNHGHLSDSDRDTLRAATAEAEAWLNNAHAEQAKRELFQNPAVTVAEVKAQQERMVRELTPIANKRPPPPPAPAPAPAPAAPPAAAEAAPAADAVPPPAPAEGAPAADANMA